MTIRLALATGADYLGVDADGPAFPAALRAEGIDAHRVVWDEPRDWTAFDAVLLRSTWDYPDKLADFLAWTRAVPRLVNSVELVAWNADKHYLAELAEAGLPVVPTRYVAPRCDRDAATGSDWAAAVGVWPPDRSEVGVWPQDCAEVVVKPAVSASARDTGRFPVGDPAAGDLIAAIHAGGRGAMVQPYLSQVDVEGEGSLVYFGGRFSHAARKTALLAPGAAPFREPEAGELTEDQPHPGLQVIEADPDQRRVADAVMAHLEDRHEVPVYARIDLLPSSARPVVLEVELIEPNLWLHAPGAPERFAAAVRAALTGR